MGTVSVVELVSVGELRRVFGGVSRTRVIQLASEEGFPPPLAVLSAGKIWDLDQIRAWADKRGRTLHPIGD